MVQKIGYMNMRNKSYENLLKIRLNILITNKRSEKSYKGFKWTFSEQNELNLLEDIKEYLEELQ